MAQAIELSSIRPANPSHFLTEDPVSDNAEDGGHSFFPRTLSSDEQTLAAIHPLWKRSLHALLEQPKSSQAAMFLHMFVTALILTSALVTVLETVPTLHLVSNGAWFGVETTLVALFTIEYVARCLAWSGTWISLLKWQTSFYGIIDLLAILPFYIEIVLQQDTSVLFRFSILRMFRLLRVFRPFRYNHTILLTIEVMYISVRRSQHALLAIGFFVIMILTVFSTLLYFAERGTWDPVLENFVNIDGDPSQFSSIPAAAWFVIVTITTVGYGEITPRSFLGRLITLPVLLFGLLLITLPSFVLGREFSHVWERMTARQNERESHASGTRSPLPPALAPIGPTPVRRTTSYPLAPAPYTPYQGYSYLGRPHTPLSSGGPVLNPNQNSYPPTALRTSTPPMMHNDLTNRKLAQNQTELSQQIGELRAALERQGEIVLGLLEVIRKGQSQGQGAYATGSFSASGSDLETPVMVGLEGMEGTSTFRSGKGKEKGV